MTVITKPGRAGATLPAFTLPLLDGGALDFSTLRGKRAVLFFWGSW
jgi:peroxiredoxin